MLLRKERVTARIGLMDDAKPLATFPRSEAGTPANTPDKQPVLRGYGVVLAVLLALLAVGATVAAVSGSARHEVVLSLVRQPEKYAELYFSGNGLTQVSPSPDRVISRVTFTVVNHEGKATRFPYAVQLVDQAETPVGRTEGSVEVADGSAAATTAAVDVPASAAWSAIEVNLQGREEHIRLLQSHHPKAMGD
jgi:hypothetical protein